MSQQQEPPDCKCGVPAATKMSHTATNPDRPFWTCASTSSRTCDFFKWAGPAPNSSSQPSSSSQGGGHPLSHENCCKCGADIRALIKQVSSTNANGNAGRLYYKCQSCQHFQFVTSANRHARPAPQPAAAGPAAEDVEYFLVDETTKAAVQQLFSVSGEKLGAGRDVVGQHDHDDLQVVNAWRIQNKERHARYSEFRRRCGVVEHHAPVPLRREFAKATRELMGAPAFKSDEALDVACNEALLLHGTKPEHLHALLFQGLDPDLAGRGLFGRGTCTRFGGSNPGPNAGSATHPRLGSVSEQTWPSTAERLTSTSRSTRACA